MTRNTAIPRYAGSLALALCATCRPSPVMRPTPSAPSAPKDDWQRSATWIHATAGAKSGQAPECRHVRRALDGEGSCKGALCRYPAELASEWLDKCAKRHPGDVEKIGDWQAAWSDAADTSPSKCAKQHARFVDEGCEAAHCRGDAAEWATRCGETEGSPLSVTILERVVSRHLEDSDKPVELDARSCETLGEEVHEGAWCATESACKKVWKVVELERERCGDENETPDIGTAMRTLAIAVGAVREPDDAPVADEPEHLEDDDAPLVFADGRGAVVMVCNKRVTELDDYLAARDGCDGSFVHVARVFGEGDERRLRRGNVRIAKDREMLALFPALAVAGEPEKEEKRRVKAFDAAVSRAIAETSLALLVSAIDDQASWIHRSKRLRDVLEKHDAELVPLFAKAAKAKVASSPSSDDPTRRGLAFRAKTRPLADVNRQGAIDPTGDTAARWLGTSALLPKATAAYAALLAPLDEAVRRGPKLRPGQAKKARENARAAATVCRDAQQAGAATQRALLGCVFDACDDARVDELAAAYGEAAARSRSAQRALDHAVSSIESDELASLAAAASCDLPSAE